MFLQRGRFYSEVLLLPREGAFFLGLRIQRGRCGLLRATLGFGVVAITLGLLALAPEGTAAEALSFVPFRRAV